MTTVSFIIPVKPGGTVRALEALRHLKPDSDDFEILIAEGCRPSSQRNQAARIAEGELLYFLDDDSLVMPDSLTICSQLFSQENVAAAGGPSLTPSDDSALQQLFGQALSSLFGAGSARNRYRRHGGRRTTSDKELILCNLAMRRSIFIEAGGLDERLYPNEENELLDRLQASGNVLLHAPDMAVMRSQRSTLRQFVRQMSSYGRGRAQQTLISGKVSLIAFIPLAFLIYLLLLPLCSALPLVRSPLYGYLLLDAAFTTLAVRYSGSIRSLALLLLFPLMHLANGYGLLRGLLGGKNGLNSPAGCDVSIRRIKSFGHTDW